jgi:tetratricopeptide (TPR) repeat protein
MKLVRAGSRDIIWSEQYPLNSGQIDQSYRDLSARIVLSLVDNVERFELSRYDVVQNPTAYSLYLMGQRYVRALDLPNVRRARRIFKASLGAYVDFVPALSGLARTYQLEWLLMARGDHDLLGEAAKLAERSLEIDPDDSRGYRDAGICKLYVGRFDESLREFSEAERRSPQHADLLADYADALQHACDARTALVKINRAIELNPLAPDRYWWTAGDVNFQLERYGDAIASISRMRDQSPAFRLFAASWAMLGEREKAHEYMHKAKDIHPDFNVKAWLSILPIRDPDFAHRYEQGLREAGFD